MRRFLKTLLKFRFVGFIALFLGFLSRLTYCRNLLESSEFINDLLAEIFTRWDVLIALIKNATIILSGDFILLLDSLISTGIFIVVLTVLFLVLPRWAKRRSKESDISILIYPTLASLVYFFYIRSYSLPVSLILLSVMVSVFFFNFYVFDSGRFLKSGPFKTFLLIFFSLMIFISEILYLPLYIAFLSSPENRERVWNRLKWLRYGHFVLLVFLLVTLLSPVKSSRIVPMDKLQSGNYYDVKFSKKEKKIFALNQGLQRLEVFPSDGSESFRVLYQPKTPKGNDWQVGHFININDERREIYFVDREHSELVVLDSGDYSAKRTYRSRFFDYGDNYLLPSGNDLYGLTENDLCVYKIDLESSGDAIMHNCLRDGEGAHMEINTDKQHLYVVNWNVPDLKYSVYVLDTKDLGVVDTIPAPVSGMVNISRDQKTLYHNVSNEMRILDPDTLGIIDRFKLPFTSQDTILDEERGLLFVGNFFTGIISVIDLKTKKTVGYHQCGDCYTRRIALDTETRRVFVATYNDGLCVSNY